MNKLADIEVCFQHFLLTGDARIQQLIVGTEKVPVETRLAIYGYAYRARLIEALVANYPALSAYMGEEAFEELANQYIDHHPSHYPSIRWFGDRLSALIKAQAAYQDYPYLPEFAEIEWTLSLVFDAADHEVITIETIQSIAADQWATMRFQPHPSLFLLTLEWNVVAIWEAMMRDETPPAPEQHPASAWIFWRKNLVEQFSPLAEDEAKVMHAFLNGATFGELVEVLCQWFNEEEAAIKAATFLKSWLAAGLIAQVFI